MNKNFVNTLNKYGSCKEPFCFLISYDASKYYVCKLKDLPSDIKYSINKNSPSKSYETSEIKRYPLSFEEYDKKFNAVFENIKAGNSYLLNLTCKTRIETSYTLDEIYEKANARFKLKFKDDFVSFSPERFIEIKKNKIFTYPMKGTIDAQIPNAKAKLLGDAKEIAEHTMVVDLLRNDLGMVAKNIKVNKFRYIDKINAGNKKLFQASSKISGYLEENWHEHIGDIFEKLLPAGSITGCPKKKTVEILLDVEAYERSFYTGIFAVFDGENLESSVLIRFIQKEDGKLFYKSGGGITSDSNVHLEYQELLDKIYLPF